MIAVCSIILFVWTLIGSLYYINMNDEVRLKPQRAVLIFISGPLIWIVKWVVVLPIDWLDICVEKFNRWMRKQQ